MPETRIILESKVKNSNIEAVAFASVDDDRGIVVSFSGGRRYFYSATLADFQAFLSAKSKGEHFNEHFKDQKANKL